MRLYEFANNDKLYEGMLTEEQLHEGFLENIKNAIGDKVDQQVKVVRNAMTAMQALYRMLSDKEHLETMTYLLKKTIKNKMRDLSDSLKLKPLMDLFEKYFPQGRGIKDFIIGLIVAAVLKVVEVAKDQALDTMVTNLVTQLTSLPALINRAVDMAGLMGIFSTLKIADTLVFDLISKLNAKIQASNSAQPAT